MVCESCGEKPKNTAKDFTKAVIEINNPEALVLLRKVVIPASMGDEESVPPAIGKYRNVLLQYEANDHIYLYSSDGIPTAITANIPQEILDSIAELEATDVVLQQEIDDLKNSPDVVDIVPTYADLQAYDTSKLGDNDIIRVLQDEQHDGQSTYYRWNATTSSWTYIGAVGDYYTKTQVDTLLAETPAFKPFPATVNTTGTTQQFLNSILALQPDTGMAYLGTVTLSDMPAGLIQEEVEVYIYNDYVAYAIMRSTDVSPYAWWCASYNYQGWQPVNTDTTYSDFTGATSSVAGAAGLVPAPTTSDPDKFLKGDGTWGTPTDTTYTAGTNVQISAQNVISATDTTYSNFVGTDGQTAGTAGLVPAPATTDAGKFLKADGTWDTAGGGGPTVVQTTGTSTTDVMSQNATTSMVFKDPSTQEIVKIGNSAIAGTSRNVAIGYYATANNTYSVAVGGQSYAPNDRATALGSQSNAQSNYSLALGNGATVYSSAPYSAAIGYNSKANQNFEHSVALGDYASTTRTGEINIGAGTSGNGYNSTNYRVLGGVHDGQTDHDAATVGQLTAYSVVSGAGAPTTSTVAQYVGQFYYDTTNDGYYYCTAITAQGTTPETYSYTWAALSTGGGSGPTVVQTTGTSQADVMSQNATTSMVFADPATATRVSIGNANAGASAVSIGQSTYGAGEYSVALGYQSNTYNGSGAVAIGQSARARASRAIAIGYSANNGNNGGGSSVAIGANTQTGDEAVSIGENAGTANEANTVSIGRNAKAQGRGSVAIGDGSVMPSGYVRGTVSFYTNATGYGYNGTSNYRLLTGVYDAQGDHDAVNLSQLNGRVKTNAGAPTTSTVGTVGQLLEDTTNGKLYQCTAVDTTDPNNPSYTWTEVGAGGSGPTVVQTTGTSQTDVMSQNAVTNMIYKDPGTNNKIVIGTGADVSAQNYNMAIGVNADANGISGTAVGYGAKARPNGTALGYNAQAGTTNSQTNTTAIGQSAYGGGDHCTAVGDNSNTINSYSTAIGASARARSERSLAIGAGAEVANSPAMAYSVALGANAVTTRAGEVNVGTGSNNFGYNSTPYRVIGGVHDAVDTHDAVTLGQLNGRVIQNAGAPTTSTAGTVGQLLEDTTNGKLYICTDATNPYVWVEVGAGGGTTYTAGSGIDITGTTISVDSTTVAMKTDVPTITMTSTDPGEGSPLAANNFVGVYGGDPIIMDYSTSEINTGATWINGAPIYKKTISIGTLPNATTKNVAHGISNLDLVIDIKGCAWDGSSTWLPIPNAGSSSATIEAYVYSSNIVITTGMDRTSFTTSYVTLYYTKSS